MPSALSRVGLVRTGPSMLVVRSGIGATGAAWARVGHTGRTPTAPATCRVSKDCSARSDSGAVTPWNEARLEKPRASCTLAGACMLAADTSTIPTSFTVIARLHYRVFIARACKRPHKAHSLV